jgi:hypothetical protein
MTFHIQIFFLPQLKEDAIVLILLPVPRSM